MPKRRTSQSIPFPCAEKLLGLWTMRRAKRNLRRLARYRRCCVCPSSPNCCGACRAAPFKSKRALIGRAVRRKDPARSGVPARRCREPFEPAQRCRCRARSCEVKKGQRGVEAHQITDCAARRSPLCCVVTRVLRFLAAYSRDTIGRFFCGLVQEPRGCSTRRFVSLASIIACAHNGLSLRRQGRAGPDHAPACGGCPTPVRRKFRLLPMS